MGSVYKELTKIMSINFETRIHPWCIQSTWSGITLGISNGNPSVRITDSTLCLIQKHLSSDHERKKMSVSDNSIQTGKTLENRCIVVWGVVCVLNPIDRESTSTAVHGGSAVSLLLPAAGGGV